MSGGFELSDPQDLEAFIRDVHGRVSGEADHEVADNFLRNKIHRETRVDKDNANAFIAGVLTEEDVINNGEELDQEIEDHLSGPNKLPDQLEVKYQVTTPMNIHSGGTRFTELDERKANGPIGVRDTFSSDEYLEGFYIDSLEGSDGNQYLQIAHSTDWKKDRGAGRSGEWFFERGALQLDKATSIELDLVALKNSIVDFRKVNRKEGKEINPNSDEPDSFQVEAEDMYRSLSEDPDFETIARMGYGALESEAPVYASLAEYDHFISHVEGAAENTAFISRLEDSTDYFDFSPDGEQQEICLDNMKAELEHIYDNNGEIQYSELVDLLETYT